MTTTMLTADWSILNILVKFKDIVHQYSTQIIILLGLIMICVAGWRIGTGLISHGKKETNWVMTAALLIVGGAFTLGGITLLTKIAEGSNDTINDLGSTVVITQPTTLPSMNAPFASFVASLLE